MTDADVERVLASAKEKGRDASWDDCAIYLKSIEYLSTPDHPKANSARRVVENFSYWMNTGERRQSFCEFDIDLATDEEILEGEKRRAAYLERTNSNG